MVRLILLISFLFSFEAMAYSSSYGKTYEDYDDIVDRLSESSRISIKSPRRRGSQRSVRANAGIGLSQSFLQAGDGVGDANGLRHGGIMLSLGVDLLSQLWGLEGVFSNFSSRNDDENEYRLKELSLKAMYKPKLTFSWQMQIGGGFSSRFLDITKKATSVKSKFETPSFLLSVGLKNWLTESITVGADVNYKTSMISESIDKRSIDLTLRLDTHF